MDQEFREAFRELSDKLDRMSERYDKVLFGNGTPGLVVKVDRLEQTDATHRRALQTISGVLAVVAGKLLYGLFK